MIDLKTWIEYNFTDVTGIRGSEELRFPCPECEHPRFYFNLDKKVGYCFKASCHYTPSLQDLIELIGTTPGEEYSRVKRDKINQVKVFIPTSAYQITEERDPWGIAALECRGVDLENIYRFQIQSNFYFIYVPVYEEDQLVQYVGRRIERGNSPKQGFNTGDQRRYDYFHGKPITNYFLGWEECKLWKEITLVENTFNAIWLRKYNVTTNFGSHLSEEQVKKIKESRIKKINILWDEGTDKPAYIAKEKLSAIGIPTKIIKIQGQPDDHSEREISDAIRNM